MAANNWSALTNSIKDWYLKRKSSVGKQIHKDAENLRLNIKARLSGVNNSKTSQEANIEAKTSISSSAKQELLSPSNITTEKSKQSPIRGLDTYVNSIIIEDESTGTDKVVVVKLDEPSKKDETTGMEVVKIAKAIEFGTTKTAPRPAWRRSLNKIGATGVYKKKF